MVRHSKFLLLIGEMLKNFILKKFLQFKKKISKCKKKLSFFKKTMNLGEILPKNQWFKKFEKYWYPSEENALKN